MARWILFLCVALGAALFFPRSRVFVLDVAEPVLNPIRIQISKADMRKISRELLSFEVTYKSLPTGRAAFDRWVTRRILNESGQSDSWGNAYQLRVTTDSFFVGSAGPDGRPGGGDDLVVGERRDDPWR